MKICTEKAERICPDFPRCFGCNAYRKPTQFDRIKDMSVEALADALMCPAEFDTEFNKERQCRPDRNCVECTKAYLESEVQGG